jgi:hypothetical protein
MSRTTVSRTIVLAVLAALAAAPAFAQHMYRYIGPDGRVTYSDQPPSSGHYTNVQPGGTQAPGTIPQSAVPVAPNQPLPAEMTPGISAPSMIPSSAVPGPDSRSTTGRVVPGTVGPDSPDRRFGLSADEQRINEDAARRYIPQGERTREADAVRLDVPQGEAARDARDVRTNVPAGDVARQRRDMQVGIPDDEARREREAVRLNQ